MVNHYTQKKKTVSKIVCKRSRPTFTSSKIEGNGESRETSEMTFIAIDQQETTFIFHCFTVDVAPRTFVQIYTEKRVRKCIALRIKGIASFAETVVMYLVFLENSNFS